MQREILFRGKRTDNGEWIEGMLSQYIEPIKATIIRNHTGVVSEFDFICVIPSTIGQYTGLTDKNDNKIFEGDILRALVFDNESGTNKKIAHWSVEYKERYTQGNGYYCYGVNRRWNRILTQSMITNCECEVIGNIHDNPELLEVSE